MAGQTNRGQRTTRTRFAEIMRRTGEQATACKQWCDLEARNARDARDVMPEDSVIFWSTADDELKRMRKALDEAYDVVSAELLRTMRDRGHA